MKGYSSQCSSSGPEDPPRKRRRVDTSKSPSSTVPVDVSCATEEMKQELVILRRKLSKAEDSLKMKNQKEKLIKQKKKLLEKDLGTTKSELSKVQEEVKNLRIENFLLNVKPVHSTCGKPLTPLQKNVIQTQKTMEAAEQKIKELEQQFSQAKGVIEELNARILSQEHVEVAPSTETHVQKLEEKLRAAEEKISVLRADVEEKYALEEQLYCLQKKWDLQRDAGVQIGDNLSSGVQHLQDNDDEVAEMTEVMIKVDPELLFFEEDSSDSAGNDEEYDPESFPETEYDWSLFQDTEDDGGAQDEDLEETQPQKDFRTIGGRSSLRPTDPKFFDIDWEKEYTRLGRFKWECRTCSHSLSTRPRIVDHVWHAHYGERFECSHCDFQFKWRSYESQHMKEQHLGLFNEKRVKKN